jgi:hypothetical protein
MGSQCSSLFCGAIPVFHRRTSQSLGTIEILGDGAFRARTVEALELLLSNSTFQIVREHVSRIQQGKRSGMKARAKEPTFIVGKRTWQHSVLWYASAIAHDAYHAKLYHESRHANGGNEPDPDSWTGTEAEKKCLAFQRQVLIALDADSETIAYLDACAQNPTYQGRNRGWRSWVDYALRRW